MLGSRNESGLASRWGWVVLRGVIAVIFGLIALARPGAMTVSMLLVFAAYAFVGGLATIISAARRGRAGESWGALLLDGVLGIAIAVLAVVWPVRTVLAFVWMIGAWAVITGALEIASAIRLRKIIENEWSLGIAGVVSILFGLVMLFRPVIGGLAIVWTLGAYALVFGVFMIVLGFRLRGFARAFRGEYPGRGLEQPG